MPTDIRTDYDELERNWCLGLGSTKYVVAKDIWLSQLASGIYAKQLGGKDNQFKLDAVVDIVSDVKDQFVIFSRWLREIYHLSTYLSLPCITGQTPFEERKRLIERFRQGEFRGIVLQPAVAARGLDLSAADTAICTSNVWGHEIRQQIEARLQHPLKRKPTEFIDIITKDSTDEVVYQLLMDKAINADSFMQKVMVKRKRKYL